MSIDEWKLLMNLNITLQHNYCRLIWICYSRALNNKINKVHEQVLRVTYNDCKLSFISLLEKDFFAPLILTRK